MLRSPRKGSPQHREQEHLLSIGKAAKILEVPVVTLRDWIKRGRVPGIRRTRGGHRRIAPEGLAAFARGHWRRGGRFPVECRSEPRVRIQGTAMTIRVVCPKTQGILGIGKGRLVDASSHGFKADRLKWQSPFIPSVGSRFLFETRRRKRSLDGIRGTALLVWSMENRKIRGGMLGARVSGFEKERWRETWERQAGRAELN